MCIVFFAISDNPKKDGYKVIIASNRDEYFNRPTKEAHFWQEYPNILSGIDVDAGGTWLGITKTGRIGMLTNYRQAPSFRSDVRKSRGDLVPGFLKCNNDPLQYIDKIKCTRNNYNGFNLIVGKLCKDDLFEFSYYCNQEHEPVENLKSGCVYGLSNRYLDYGWKKISLGKERFQRVVEQECPVDDKINLLFELLQDETRHPVDEMFIGPQDDGIPKQHLEALTAISVLFDNNLYGTRTNTVIIVDDKNNATFVERTMEEPIDVKDIQWKTSTFKFTIHS